MRCCAGTHARASARADPRTDCTVIVPAGTTLSTAIGNAPSGATVCLRGGTHTVASVIYTGKSLNIVAYPGEVPVITHPTNRPDFLYFTGGPVLVRGVTFAAGASAPSYNDANGSALSEVEGGHDVTYENVTSSGPDRWARPSSSPISATASG